METLVGRSLGRFGPAWDALVDVRPVPSPFLRSWWLDAAAGPNPAFVLVVEGEQLLGGLALEEHRRLGVPWFRHLGEGPLWPEHLDLVAEPGVEDAVIESLSAWLGRPGSRVIDLNGIAGTSRLQEALPPPVRRSDLEPAPYAVLPDDGEAFLAGLPPRLRNTVRRTGRRFEGAGATFRAVSPDEIDRALEDLRRLHEARWGDRSGFLPAFGSFATAARAGAARGEVAFHELVVGDEVVASEVDFDVGGRTTFYQAGRAVEREWRGSGTLLRARVIERACCRGSTEYDLLGGAGQYKREWASRSRELVRLRGACGARGRAALAAVETRERAAAAKRRARERWGSQGAAGGATPAAVRPG